MNVLGTTRILGVFGHPISHSLSPVMHNAAIQALNIDYIYVPFHVVPHELGGAVSAIRSLDLAGVNVTIPHKERLIELVDEAGVQARRIGSANTVVNTDGRLRAESTDGPGFLRSAEAIWGKIEGSRVLVLGAGGSAKAICYALADADCDLTIANRTYGRAVELSDGLNAAFGRDLSKPLGLEREGLAEEIARADLLVNTTSVGMHPASDGIPIPAELLRPGLAVYDLVYNPSRTRLVVEAEARGASAVNGIGMLVYQGALSFEMWTGLEPPVAEMEEAVRGALECRV